MYGITMDESLLAKAMSIKITVMSFEVITGFTACEAMSFIDRGPSSKVAGDPLTDGYVFIRVIHELTDCIRRWSLEDAKDYFMETGQKALLKISESSEMVVDGDAQFEYMLLGCMLLSYITRQQARYFMDSENWQGTVNDFQNGWSGEVGGEVEKSLPLRFSVKRQGILSFVIDDCMFACYLWISGECKFESK